MRLNNNQTMLSSRSLLSTTLSLSLAGSAFADVTLADLTYSTNGSVVTISDCATTASGVLDLASLFPNFTVETIATDAFRNCNLITEARLNQGVVTLEHGAFEHCSGLTSVSFDHGITTIGTFSFRNCTQLKSVSLPDSVTSLGRYSFYACSSLESAFIPSSVKVWETALFHQCRSLGSITIPEGVTTLEGGVFTYCENILSITLPSTLTSYVKKTNNGGTFNEMAKLQLFAVAAGNTYLATNGGALYSADLSELHQVPAAYSGGLTIPDATTTIHQYAFRTPCEAITNIQLGTGLTDIAPELFANMSSLTSFSLATGHTLSVQDGVLLSGDGSEIIAYPTAKAGSYTFPASVTTVRDSAFENRLNISSVTTSSTLSNLGARAFYSCVSLTHATLNGTLTELPDNAFNRCEALATVQLAPSITALGKSAFSRCDQLSSIDCSNIEQLGQSCFFNSESLTSIRLSSKVSAIPDYCFNSSGLTHFDCPADLTSIGDEAFAGAALQSINFNNGLLTIADEAFSGMEHLRSVILPASITDYGEYAFYDSPGIEYVEFAEGATTTGHYTFNECPNLKSAILPSTINTMDEGLFYDCEALEHVLFRGNAPTSSAGENFYGTDSSLRLYYYSGATGWAFTFDEIATQAINSSANPAAEWLLVNSLSPVTDVNLDSSNDGVPLILEYALDLDPDTNNSSALPQIEMNNGNAELSYFAGRNDLIYTIEHSSDLDTWTSIGVTKSPLDSDSMQTASVPATEDKCFLKLTVAFE